MKIIIVIILLIGFAMGAKSGKLINASTNMWTLTFNDIGTSTTINRNMSLTIDSGTATGSYHSATAKSVGVICLTTTNNYTLTANTASIASFVLSIAGTGATTTTAVTNWDALIMYSGSTATYVSDTAVTIVTTALGTCNAATPSTPSTSSATDFSITYAWTVATANTCTGAPTYATLSSYYAKCMYKADHDTAASLNTVVAHTGLASVTNVTIGASTLAVGATIMAGTAYLAF